VLIDYLGRLEPEGNYRLRNWSPALPYKQITGHWACEQPVPLGKPSPFCIEWIPRKRERGSPRDSVWNRVGPKGPIFLSPSITAPCGAVRLLSPAFCLSLAKPPDSETVLRRTSRFSCPQEMPFLRACANPLEPFRSVQAEENTVSY
jgi:hypothetical protein